MDTTNPNDTPNETNETTTPSEDEQLSPAGISAMQGEGAEGTTSPPDGNSEGQEAPQPTASDEPSDAPPEAPQPTAPDEGTGNVEAPEELPTPKKIEEPEYNRPGSGR